MTRPMSTQHSVGPDESRRVVFETRRLIVRRWCDSDLDSLMRVYGDTDAMRWVGDGRPLGEPDCRAWLSVTQRNYETRGYGMFAVECPSAPGVIGFIGLVHPAGQEQVEVKYAFARPHWGLGFATEALSGLLSYAAQVLSLKRVIATVAPENLASQAVLKKAGMTRTGGRANEDGSLTDIYEYFAS
ncbi:MAG: hypothetical protein RL320_1704 [Pseudomonadota bacterium]